jgi:riboflavin biosynthesis pyrimidine reductase
VTARPPVDFESLRDSQAVEDAIGRLLGRGPGSRSPSSSLSSSSILTPSSFLSPGVVHVVAVWRDRRGALRVLRIGDRTPRSAHDRFLLSLARARAEGIVTTGAILRAEPDVRWTLDGPGGARRALGEWRRSRWPEAREPWLAILTSGRDLDLDHPGLREGVRPLVVTGAGAAARLSAGAAERGIAVVAVAEPGGRAALAALRARAAARITVEVGPTAARSLYLEPLAVDELWLAAYLGVPPEEVVGEELLAADRLAALLEPCAPAFEVEEASGRWRFERLRPVRPRPA